MLLKNMAGGLANGTRLIVTRIMAHLIEAKVTTGPSKDQIVLIPRLNHTQSNPEKMPFTLQRRQFPVRPAFAMTINKSQGQTFKHIGIFLRESVFSHGQLYVALSRVGTRSGVHIYPIRKFTFFYRRAKTARSPRITRGRKNQFLVRRTDGRRDGQKIYCTVLYVRHKSQKLRT